MSASLRKSIKIPRAKARKVTSMKKSPDLEKFYQPSTPFMTQGGARGPGYNVTLTLPPEPLHGVSGYACTGTTSSFQIQPRSSPALRVPFENVDPTTSSFELRDSGSTREIFEDGTPFTVMREPEANVSDVYDQSNFNYRTPTVELQQELAVVTPGLTTTRRLQASRDPQQESYLRRRLFEGVVSMDPLVENMLRDEGKDEGVQTDVSHHRVTPNVSGGTHVFNPISASRHNQENGTVNPVYQIISAGLTQTPQGQGRLPDINAEHTPPLINTGNTNAGAHPQEGGAISLPGGWTQGSNQPFIAGTIVPINPTPYLTLGQPPQPPIIVSGGTGTISPVTPQNQPYQFTHRPMQFQL